MSNYSMTGRTHTSKCADGAGSRFYFDPKGDLKDDGARCLAGHLCAYFASSHAGVMAAL